MKKILMVLIALVLVGGGVYWFVIRDTASDTTKEEDTTTLTTADVIKATIITYTDDGFVPAKYLGSVGGTLTVQNDSSSDVDFESNDHPTHTKNSELNVGTVKAGESKTIDLSKKGEWCFHNHLNSTHTGSITVE